MKKNIILSVVFALGMFCSCTDFDELNINPDSVSKVTPGMLATKLLKGFAFWNPNSSDYASGNLWLKQTTLCETNPNPYQYYYSYWAYGSVDYSSLTDAKRMMEFAQGTSTEASYKGLFLFLKARSGYNKTITLGDVPYSEILRAEEGIMYPKYDKQKDVFEAVLADLKEAESLFAQGQNFDGDFLYDGDASKWRKLCNYLQLRVLLTMSKKITPEYKARFAEIVSAGNLMESNDDNFQMDFLDNPNAYYPYYNGETKRKKHAIAKLLVDELIRLKDRRLFYFAEPAPALLAEGKTESNFEAYAGAPSELSAEQLAVNNDNGEYSLLNKRYPVYKVGDPHLIHSYADQCFMIAEAIEEGWLQGDSKAYYENGVKAMLKYYMDLPIAASDCHGMAITQDYIDNYFTGAAAYADTKEERLKQIWMQAWIAYFFQGETDAYFFNFLRTGYPEFPLDPETSMNPDNRNAYPKRWMYPQDEQTKNPENYQKAIDEQFGGVDTTDKTPWYLQ